MGNLEKNITIARLLYIIYLIGLIGSEYIFHEIIRFNSLTLTWYLYTYQNYY